MKFFYIDENLSESGVKKIHAQGCANMPDMMNRRYLGPFNNSEEALRRISQQEPAAKICQECGK
ncbi:hypothetical protein [Litoribacter populi]|uniref:hypothetical protein n=1 Tax=Litoribacter populi TaxID=2598460 RepID=UPI0011810889|nr:hypothetical protein [Litoribacter populi]